MSNRDRGVRFVAAVLVAALAFACGARTGVHDPDSGVAVPSPPATDPDAGGCFLPLGEPIVLADREDLGDSVYRILPDPVSQGFVLAGDGAFEPRECEQREDPRRPPPRGYIGFVAADRRIERVWRFNGAVVQPTNVFITRDRDEVVAVIQTYHNFELGPLALAKPGFAVAWFGPHGDIRSTGAIDDPVAVPRFTWAASNPVAGAVPVAHLCTPETRAFDELVCPEEGMAVSFLDRGALVWSISFARATDPERGHLEPHGLVTMGSTVLVVIIHDVPIVFDGTVIAGPGVDYIGVDEHLTSFIALETERRTARHVGSLFTQRFDSIYDRVAFVPDGRRAYFGIVADVVDEEEPAMDTRELYAGVVDLDAGTVELGAPRPSYNEESVLDVFLDGPTRYVSICTSVRGPGRLLVDEPGRSVEHRVESGCVADLAWDAAGGIVTAGWFEGAIDIPGVRAESATWNDGFVGFLR